MTKLDATNKSVHLKFKKDAKMSIIPLSKRASMAAPNPLQLSRLDSQRLQGLTYAKKKNNQ